MASKECAVCTQPSVLFCESCADIDANGIFSNVRWYCTALCQEIDQLDHKGQCRLMTEQKDLSERAKRAGEVAQALFYTFIEHTWAYDMSSARTTLDHDGVLVAMETIAGPGVRAGPGEGSTCERHAGGWLVKFPHNCFQPADQEAKRALLASQNSIWAFVCMHVAIQALFEDLVDDVEHNIKEVVHYLPDNAQRLVQHRGRFGFVNDERDELPYPDKDGNGNLKGVYQITLKNGSKISLDLAGAQYNLEHDTIMPWSDYLTRWVRRFKYRIPFRSHHVKHFEKMSTYNCITHLTVIMEQTRYFNSLMKGCEYVLSFNLKDMAAEDIETFRDNKHRLLVAATKHLQQRPADLDGTSTECLVAPFDLRHPKIIEKVTKSTHVELPQSIPFDIGSMKNFDWDKLRKMIKMPSNKVTYKEKKKAKLLLQHRCAYKMPGDWKLAFLIDTLPSLRVPAENVSENPYWEQRKRKSLI